MPELKTVDIRLPDGLVDYLQTLDYEVGGLRVLHTHAMNAGAPREKLEELRERFQEKFQEYQLAKQELYDEYMVLDGALEPVGNWAVDLTDYQPKEAGKGLSTNDFTDEDKAKLDGMTFATDAEVDAMLDEVFGTAGAGNA